MLFRSLIYSALLVGLIAGVVMSVQQHFHVTPIIFAAESFEEPGGESAGHHHDHGHSHGHSHSHDAWAPADGAERTFFTFLSNVLAGAGFAALMLGAMFAVNFYRGKELSPARGLLWGLAGFAAFFLAPAIGIPPEIPGIEAAPVEHRQLWWFATVVLTIACFMWMFLAKGWKKYPALALLALPFVFGAPHPETHGFSHSDPAAVSALEALHMDFIIASTLANAVFWLVIGVVSAWVAKKWVVPSIQKMDMA